MKYVNRYGTLLKKILQLKGTPESIARGFALGSFIGMMPVPGFQMIIALSVASLLRFNRKSACIAVFNTNLATGLFIFAFNFWLGKKILGFNIDFTMPSKLGFGFIRTVIDSGFDVFISMTLGGIITGVLVAAVSYRIIKRVLNKRKMNTHNTSNNEPGRKQYAVITGASLGLGRSLATECAVRGYNLILISLPNEDLQALGDDLQQKYNIDVAVKEADLTDPAQLDKTTCWVNKNYRVGILVNNAGVGGSMPFNNVSAEYIDKIILLNIRALVHLTHSLADNLKSNSQAYILNVASLASFGPMPYKTVYPASKAFVYSFSRSLGVELKNEGISVSVVHPGGMATNKDVTERINRYGRIVRSTILSPEKTAGIAIRRLLKKDALIIPGAMNKLSWLFFKICPVWLQLKIFNRSVKRELGIKKVCNV